MGPTGFSGASCAPFILATLGKAEDSQAEAPRGTGSLQTISATRKLPCAYHDGGVTARAGATRLSVPG